MQLPKDPQKIVMIGYQSARIEHDQSHDQWVLRDSRQNITARTQAGQLSFALGKHNWTISGDRHHCSGGRDYTIEMKLTGCKDGKFTCNNGQCVAMEERCDQVPQCRDHSDEHNCRIVVIQRGYNKEVAPIKISEKKTDQGWSISSDYRPDTAESSCYRRRKSFHQLQIQDILGMEGE